jgi:hypothetical protein
MYGASVFTPDYSAATLAAKMGTISQRAFFVYKICMSRATLNIFVFYFQELDYVYHDVSAVMTESLMQGADIIAVKVSSTASSCCTVIFLSPTV